MARGWVAVARIRGAGLFGDEAILAHLGLVVGQPLLLEPEPTNPVDASAVIVRDLLGVPLGYVERAIAAEVAASMRRGLIPRATVVRAPITDGALRYRVARARIWFGSARAEHGIYTERGAPRREDA